MFEIFYDETVTGQAEMVKEGLYYRIRCTCTLPNSGIHRIILADGEAVQNLGICVPVKDKFVLNASVPVKNIKGDSPKFYLVAGKTNGIPVATGALFSHLDKLETARLQITNGQSEIVIQLSQDTEDCEQTNAQMSELSQD